LVSCCLVGVWNKEEMQVLRCLLLLIYRATENNIRGCSIKCTICNSSQVESRQYLSETHVQLLASMAN
jgi:hypothetical protein